MRPICLFMMMSLDGFIEGVRHDLSWHMVDEEFNTFATRQLQEADTLLFGRRTYQLMEDFWPSKEARETDPVVANLMNTTQKVVFSRTLKKVKETPYWKKVQLRENVEEIIKSLKAQPGKAIIVLGSNNFCVTLLALGLLDEIRIMVNPVVIGKGTPLFSGIQHQQKCHLKNARQFKNGNILLTYTVIKGGENV